MNVESCPTFVQEGERGPAEPDGDAGAVASSIASNAQVDEYVVRYASQAAATTAIDRTATSPWSVRAHWRPEPGRAVREQRPLGGAVPAAVNGYRVVAHFGSGSAAFEEYTGVLQWVTAWPTWDAAEQRTDHAGRRTDRPGRRSRRQPDGRGRVGGVAVVALGRQGPDHAGHRHHDIRGDRS